MNFYCPSGSRRKKEEKDLLSGTSNHIATCICPWIIISLFTCGFPFLAPIARQTNKQGWRGIVSMALESVAKREPTSEFKWGFAKSILGLMQVAMWLEILSLRNRYIRAWLTHKMTER